MRNGNPKNIRDWDDLVKPGVQVIVVNPKTGGNGRMAYLAAWGYVRKKGGTDAQAAEFVGKLYKNVPILAKGGRDATSIFLQRNTGDVLITFESEVLCDDVIRLELSYYHPDRKEWLSNWQTTQADGFPDRLPSRVRVKLVIHDESVEGEQLAFYSEVRIPLFQLLDTSPQANM